MNLKEYEYIIAHSKFISNRDINDKDEECYFLTQKTSIPHKIGVDVEKSFNEENEEMFVVVRSRSAITGRYGNLNLFCLFNELEEVIFDFLDKKITDIRNKNNEWFWR